MKLLLSVLSLSLLLSSVPYYWSAPENNPQLLFEGSLSDNLPQWNNYFNRKNRFGLFTQMDGSASRIIRYDYANDTFQEGQFLPFDGDYMLVQSNISALGDPQDEFKICESFLTNDGWTQPAPIPELVDNNKNEGSPSLVLSGNLYFNALSESGDYDIFVLKNGSDKPEALSRNINSTTFEGDFFIDDKEQFIVFSSANRLDSQGGTDLYISFKTEKGWTPALALDKGINTEGEDFSPYITNDRKQLIFTSNRNNTTTLRPSYNHYIIDFDIQELKSLYID